MLYESVSLPEGAKLHVYATPSPVDPSLTLPCIIIFPGGGYSGLSPREGEPIALRFAGLGFVTCVLEYRVAPARFPCQVQDAGAAVNYIRTHADAYHVNPDAIAIMGFSAGGHAAGSLGVMWTDESLWQPLHLTPAQVRPNAMVLAYPVISGGEFAHRGSFVNLSGSDALADHHRFSLEKLVSADTPPTFLWHTWEDQSVPVENTLLFAMALRHFGVTAEVRIYPHGPHGAALCTDFTANAPGKTIPEAQDWPEQAARFLRDVM